MRLSGTSLRGSRRSAIWVSVLALALCTFSLYGVTAGRLVGYEGETAAVAEGLVMHGALRVHPGGVFSSAAIGIPGRAGHRYSRTGLTQPLLEAPLYAGGLLLDRVGGGGRDRFRLALIQLFDPAMAALAVCAIYGLLILRGCPAPRALKVAALCAVATIIWPYAKIGMETTLMAMLALAFLACAWAAAKPTGPRLGLAGLIAGAAGASKPYGVVLICGLLPLLWPVLRPAVPARRVRMLASLGLPLLIWLLAVAAYNAYRTGSITNFGNPYFGELLATPINAVGMFVSPGKGLLLYSPLGILGVLGLRGLRRLDPALAAAAVLTVGLNTLVLATTSQWGDETWGARYLVPSAWLLVLPLAWGRWSSRRRRVAAGVAVIGVAVQLVGVLVAYPVSAEGAALISGETVYPYLNGGLVSQRAAYGPDGPRWIPEASPLLFQSEVVLAWAKEHVTGTGFVTTYRPYLGRTRRIDLRHPERTLGAQIPDFWWLYPGESALSKALAAVLLAVGAAAATLLWQRRRMAAGNGPGA